MPKYMIFFLFFLNMHFSIDAYIYLAMPGRFLYRRELASWQCAQQCFNRADDIKLLDTKRRRKRSVFSPSFNKNIDDIEYQALLHLEDYCSKSLEELACLEKCAESDVKRKLLDYGKHVEILACSNVTEAVRAYTCITKNADIPTCIEKNCQNELDNFNLALEEKANLGIHAIPGKEFCNLEDCNRQCMKMYLPNACGSESFLLYKNLNDLANVVQSLMTYDVKPPIGNGILCIDRLIPDNHGNAFEEKESE